MNAQGKLRRMLEFAKCFSNASDIWAFAGSTVSRTRGRYAVEGMCHSFGTCSIQQLDSSRTDRRFQRPETSRSMHDYLLAESQALALIPELVHASWTHYRWEKMALVTPTKDRPKSLDVQRGGALFKGHYVAVCSESEPLSKIIALCTLFNGLANPLAFHHTRARSCKWAELVGTLAYEEREHDHFQPPGEELDTKSPGAMNVYSHLRNAGRASVLVPYLNRYFDPNSAYVPTMIWGFACSKPKSFLEFMAAGLGVSYDTSREAAEHIIGTLTVQDLDGNVWGVSVIPSWWEIERDWKPIPKLRQ